MITPLEIQGAVEVVENFRGLETDIRQAFSVVKIGIVLANGTGSSCRTDSREIFQPPSTFRQAARDWMTIYDWSPEGPLRRLAKAMMCANHNEASIRDL